MFALFQGTERLRQVWAPAAAALAGTVTGGSRAQRAQGSCSPSPLPRFSNPESPSESQKSSMRGSTLPNLSPVCNHIAQKKEHCFQVRRVCQAFPGTAQRSFTVTDSCHRPLLYLANQTLVAAVQQRASDPQGGRAAVLLSSQATCVTRGMQFPFTGVA